MAKEIWQADLGQSSLQDEQGKILWQLLITDAGGDLIYQVQSPQTAINSQWLVTQLQKAAQGRLPQLIQIFRPQVLGIFELASAQLGINLEATGRTYALKQYLKKQQGLNLKILELSPPQPLPESLWGQSWRFASLTAGDLELFYSDRPMPILEIPPFLAPFNFGLPSHLPIPGIVIEAGRQSLTLARWLQQSNPVSIEYISSPPGGGLILNAGLQERWILMTFADLEVAKAAHLYQQRQLDAQGLHFLLVQPDDSGMTYTGFWLLLTT